MNDTPSAEPLQSVGRFALARLSAGGFLSRLAPSKQPPRRGASAAAPRGPEKP